MILNIEKNIRLKLFQRFTRYIIELNVCEYLLGIFNYVKLKQKNDEKIFIDFFCSAYFFPCFSAGEVWDQRGIEHYKH